MGTGCSNFKDLVNVQEKRMCTYLEFCERYGKLNVLDYMSLTHSIPKEWKTYVCSYADNVVDESVMPTHLVNLINADKGCKHVYWLLINTKLNKQNYNNEIKWMAQYLFRTERGDRLSWTGIYYMAIKAYSRFVLCVELSIYNSSEY